MCARTVARLCVVVAVCLMGLPGVATATSGTWTLDGSDLWDDAVLTPWNFGLGPVADGAGNTADFSTIDITLDRTVSLNAARTIGNVTFGDIVPGSAAGWTLDNNGIPANTLNLSGPSTITVNALGAGKGVTISADVGLAANTTTAAVAAGSFLTLSGNVTSAGGGGSTTTLQKSTASGTLNVAGNLFSAADPSKNVYENPHAAGLRRRSIK